jgi:EAL domain-containing protein (putative c-di-GMP-specific phosphodiesterase class I)
VELREKIIIELTEHIQVNDMNRLQICIQNIRNLGIRIAIDDFGVGYSNINIYMSIDNDFMKIDAQLIEGIDKVEKKKELIRRIVDYNMYAKTKTICEGIETKEELEILIEVGVDYGQGYYLGKPDKIAK